MADDPLRPPDEPAAAAPPPGPPSEPPLSPAPLPPAPPVPRASLTALRAALKEGNVAGVAAALAALEPEPRAELFVQLKPAEQASVLRASPAELAAALVTDCDSGLLAQTFRALEPAAVAEALRLVPPDAMADLAVRLPEEVAKTVLDELAPDARDEIRRLMTFAPESAGGMMTTRYLAVPEVVSAGRALETLRAARGADPASYVYTVDAFGRLAGLVPLHALVTAPPRASVRDIMFRNPVRVRTSAPPEDLIAHFRQRRFLSLPVVDDKDRLVGIVTAARVLSAAEEAGDEVLRQVTGADPREAFESPWRVARSRLPWLASTLAGGLACAAVAALFRDTLESMVFLGIFLPIVLAVGESAGAQTASVVLAALAERSLPPGGIRRLALKELAVGVIAAMFAGSALVGIASVWPGNPKFGLVVGGAVAISVAWAALLGAVVPAAMRGTRVNPAIASGPIVLVLSDVSTLGLYLGAATVFRETL